jgi:hypothetical protein
LTETGWIPGHATRPAAPFSAEPNGAGRADGPSFRAGFYDTVWKQAAWVARRALAVAQDQVIIADPGRMLDPRDVEEGARS